MLRNYLLLTVRNLLRRKTYALINLVGLTLGLACIALVVLYSHYERGYDQFHERSEDIYRLEHHFRSSWYSTLGYNNYFQSTVADQMAYPLHLREFPQVEEATQVIQVINTYVEADDRHWVVDNILYTLTGEALLDIFTLEWVSGTPESALSQPFSAVITDQTAERFFGGADPLGATIIHDSTELTITGVVKPMPQNSHLHPDLIMQLGRIPHWGAHTYVRVQPGTDMRALAEQIVPPNERYAASDLFKGVRFTPLAGIHFAEPTKYDFQLPGDSRYLYSFLAIGLLILVITATNYMNLSIAMYSHRNREIGIRKVAGARRSQIAGQFLLEACLLSLSSLPLAIGLVELVLPAFNDFMGVDLATSSLLQFVPGSILLGTALFTGLVAGSYPAWLLSRRGAAALFKPLQRGRKEGLSMRRSLLTVQFMLLIALGSASWLVNRQLTYMQQKDLGFSPEGVISIKNMDGAEAYRRFRQLVENVPGVMGVASGAPPGSNSNKLTYKGQASQEIFANAINRWVDYAYFDVLQIECPTLDRLRASGGPLPDTLYLINQAAADQLGYGDEAVGKLLFEEPVEEGESLARTIEGVIPDFHYYSLHEAIIPQLYRAFREPAWVYEALVRVEGGSDVAATVAALEQAYQEVLPEQPFVYRFLEEDLLLDYRQERRISTLGTVLSGIAIALTLIGLMGMAAFLANLRRKEIGIRRVLGASPQQILSLLNRDFFWLVALGMGLATPIAWWALDDWLASFAYRISVNPWVFVIAGITALALAILAVSVQGLRTIRRNPADILRDE